MFDDTGEGDAVRGRDMLEKRLSGNQLKLIAVLSMLTDHAGYALYNGIIEGTPEPAAEYPVLYGIYLSMRVLGRIAFPIFAYLLVEGFFHTGNRRKYILRMGIFAMISEIPFNLFLTGSLFFPQYQNVFFTFVIGLCMMSGMEAIRRRVFGELGLVLQLLLVVAASGLAWILCVDYQFYGIMLIAVFYWFYGRAEWQCLLGFLWQMNCEAMWISRGGLLVSFLLLYLYNGERGKRKFGYAFYLFYPAHLLMLSWIFVNTINKQI